MEWVIASEWAEWPAAHPSDMTHARTRASEAWGDEARVEVRYGWKVCYTVYVSPRVAALLHERRKAALIHELRTRQGYVDISYDGSPEKAAAAWMARHAACCANDAEIERYLNGDEAAIGRITCCGA